MPQRYVIVGITAIAALFLYIDRVCFSTLAPAMSRELLLPAAPEPGEDVKLSEAEIKAAKKKKRKDNPELGEDVELTAEDILAAKKKQWADSQMAFALSAFFLTYALFQIPMGRLADRFGARKVLAISIAAWSLVTMATGFVGGVLALLGIRLLLGITEAGAYPAAAGLVKNWAPPEQRGRFSSMVAFGGRIGGVVAPYLTKALAIGLVGYALVEWAIPTTPAPPGPDGKPPPNWRGVFVVYGVCGLLVALLFWMMVRDRPPTGILPPSPAAPLPAPTGTGTSGGEPKPAESFLQQIKVFARSRNMWLFGSVQFGVNLGWVLLITLLPSYLDEEFDTPLEDIGTMQSVALGIGCLGMIFGGVTTDALRRRLGPRYGRSIPIAVALGICVPIFLLVPGLGSAWAVVIALGLMAFLVDMHNPSIWSFAQDVGGKKVGAALGWGNMWGNIGGALSAVVIREIQQAEGWGAAFTFCAVAFAAAAACGLMLDATKPVEPEVAT